MDKKSIRKNIKALLNEHISDFSLWSQDICIQIINSPEYKSATKILAYSSLPDEVNINPVIQNAAAAGKKVYLPVVDAQKGTMDFYLYDGASELKAGEFGIMEPDCMHEAFEFGGSEKILVLVPGRAFTLDGKRLGRGKGFYDRYFEKRTGNVSLEGVCFKLQIAEDLPVDEFDVKMKKIFFNQQ